MKRLRLRLTFDVTFGVPVDETEEPEVLTDAVSTTLVEPPPDDDWFEEEDGDDGTVTGRSRRPAVGFARNLRSNSVVYGRSHRPAT